ncbi:hypothetical protein CONPUDRAFT_150812 [Coniophora puteana RWD-64-598 SS2]|uniref:Uncharacterized protein n=1 Tax=Coniophora puteana (strain RWD-64-598) TaxID=741705 RepID=A0A5M3MYT0_CONPW|nr:uncharacterized protein CONPUDRAFT_150812 [Coniophora puteana RWD-64-598 SS2]EIW83751.1 hypothetical protein CONPUDRAFT_150812 [Coniophora puteana RWD-64-598 SS2]
MKSFTSFIAFLTFVASGVLGAQPLTMNMPANPCFLLGAEAQHRIPCVDANDTPINTIETYHNLSGNSLDWLANVNEGVVAGFQLTDSEGNLTQSAPVQVQGSTSSSCLP